jgi:hypothetical protein
MQVANKAQLEAKQNSIIFKNERSEYITKEKNNLGAWDFFKYLYSKHSIKILGANVLALLFVVAIYIVSAVLEVQTTSAVASLPYANSFGLGLLPWGGIETYMQDIVLAKSTLKHLIFLGLIPVATVGVCGIFAVIRDAYWTGKFKVIKPFFKGVYQSGLQVLPFAVVIAGGFLGIHFFSSFVTGWLNVFGQVVFYIILSLFAMWAFIFAGVTCLYRQSFADNVKTSFKLFYSYFVSNLFTFIFAVLPFVLLIVVNVYFVSLIIGTLILMFGMLYFSLLWMIHNIRICGNHPFLTDKPVDPPQKTELEHIKSEA